MTGQTSTMHHCDSQQQAQVAWSRPATELTQTSVNALLAGKIPAIRLAQFASFDECRAFIAAIAAAAPRKSAATTSPMTLIGSNFSNASKSSKDAYFTGARQSQTDLARITDASFDPVQRMLNALQHAWPDNVAIASEPGHGEYFAGGIKARLEASALHYDYVPRTTTNYLIANIIDQFSWNLYLEMPKNGGRTTLFDAPVAPLSADPEANDRAWNNGLDAAWVEGKASFTFQPQVGEVVLFNTRNPHTIESSAPEHDEQRIQIGSFIGRLPDNSLVLWS